MYISETASVHLGLSQVSFNQPSYWNFSWVICCSSQLDFQNSWNPYRVPSPRSSLNQNSTVSLLLNKIDLKIFDEMNQNKKLNVHLRWNQKCWQWSTKTMVGSKIDHQFDQSIQVGMEFRLQNKRKECVPWDDIICHSSQLLKTRGKQAELGMENVTKYRVVGDVKTFGE